MDAPQPCNLRCAGRHDSQYPNRLALEVFEFVLVMLAGAHARSLLHYETHVRAARGGGLNAAALRNMYYQDEEVIFLQVIRILIYVQAPADA
jgi:hypothetical protein